MTPPLQKYLNQIWSVKNDRQMRGLSRYGNFNFVQYALSSA